MAVRQRIVAGTAAQLSWQAVDQYGEPADPGTTTVGVTSSAGSTVVAAGSAATAAGTVRTVSIAAHAVDLLTAVWEGATATETTEIDVVGGVYFTDADLRTTWPEVSVKGDYTPEAVREQRAFLETMFEQSTGVAFVPRFKVVDVASGGVALLRGVRSVRWVRLYDDSFVTDATEIAALVELTGAGVRCASSVVRVGVVVGFDAPPADVKRAAMLYARNLLTEKSSQVDMRVLALTAPDGSMMRMATPGLSVWVTGIPEVDETLKRYRGRQMPRTIRPGAWFV